MATTVVSLMNDRLSPKKAPPTITPTTIAILAWVDRAMPAAIGVSATMVPTLVPMLMDMKQAATNSPASSIAKELYKRGIPTPAEYKIAKGQKTHDISRTHGIWCDSTIVRYLADERYTGTYIIGKRAVREVGGNNSRFKDRS